MLASLEAARDAVRRQARPETTRLCLRELGEALGSAHLEPGSERAILAVLDHLEHPGLFPRDQDAWEAHGAKRTAFKSWKQRIQPIFLNAVVDSAPDNLLQEVDRAGLLRDDRHPNPATTLSQISPDSLGLGPLFAAWGCSVPSRINNFD